MTRSARSLLVVLLLSCAAAARAQPWAYVGSVATPAMSVIDIATNRLVATIPAALGSSAVSPDGRRVYLADGEHWQLRVFDTASASLLHTVELESPATGLVVAPDGERVYVAIEGRTVWAIDPHRGEIVGAVGTGPDPSGLAIAPSGTRLFVADDYGRGVTVVDTATLRVVQRIELSSRPLIPGNVQALAIDPNGTRLYAGEYFSRALTVVDLATYRVVDQIEVGPSPIALAVAPDGRHVYASLATSDLAVVDVATRAVEHVSLPGQPGSLALTPDGTRLYVLAARRAFAVDTATRAVVGSILTEDRPTAFAAFITGSARNPICPGDRDGDGVVSVDELITGVARALGGCPAPPLRCDGDLDADGQVDIAELTRAVGTALGSCPTAPPPPATPTPDPVATPTAPRCVGDCNGDQVVSVDEVALAGAIANGTVPPERCVAQPAPNPYEADAYAIGPCSVRLTEPDPTAANRLVVTTSDGHPDGVVTVSVALSTGEATITGVQGTLIVPPDLPLESCAANPNAGTRVLVGLLPHSCVQGADCLRARIMALWPDLPTPIADGTALFSCTIRIPAAAAPGTYPLVLRGVGATDALGNPVPLGALDGALPVLPRERPAVP